MIPVTRVAQYLVRALGAVMVLLGVLFWTGNALMLIPLHMLLGIGLVLTVWSLAAIGVRAGVHLGLVLFALAWGVVVPVLGMTQDSLVVGPAHVVVQILHLLVGVTAIGTGELLARRIRLHQSSRSAARSAILATTQT